MTVTTSFSAELLQCLRGEEVLGKEQWDSTSAGCIQEKGEDGHVKYKCRGRRQSSMLTNIGEMGTFIKGLPVLEK